MDRESMKLCENVEKLKSGEEKFIETKEVEVSSPSKSNYKNNFS
jgi:hypothetical protein